MALSASHKAFINSRATAHMMKDVSVDTCKDISSVVSIGAAGSHKIKGTDHGESIVRPPRSKMSDALNRVLNLQDVEHSFVSV